jgi:hypothetical protein
VQGVSDEPVYKYRDGNNRFHIDLLSKQLLWIPNFLSLNDPFDGDVSLLFETNSPESKYNLRNFNKSEIREAWNFGISPQSSSCAIKRTIRWMGGLSGDRLWKEKFTHHSHRSIHLFWGVSCFSTDPLNSLLWTHYGNNHAGFCVGFNRKQLLIDYLSATRAHLRGMVQYLDEMQYLPVPSDETDFLRSYFLVKSQDWSYEKEYRILTPYLCLKSIPLSEKTFEEITFGLRTTQEHKDEILNVVKRAMPHVKVYQMSKLHGFKLGRELIL